MTPRRPIGVHQGEGGSRRESSLPPIGCLVVIYDSQFHYSDCLYSRPRLDLKLEFLLKFKRMGPLGKEVN